MTTNPEIELFLDHSAWLCPRLSDPTRRGLVAWLSGHVGPAVRAQLQRQMPVLNPLHEQAETALLELLGRDLNRCRRAIIRRPSPARSVDWQATYLESLCGTPHEFISTASGMAVDVETIRALRGLATTWAQALESFDDDRIQYRARRLRAARDLHPAAAPVAFSDRHARALASIDRAAASAVQLILRVIDFWNHAFGADGDRQSLLSVAGLLAADDVPNINTLLEVTARLSIARIATSVRASAQGPYWQATPESWAGRNGIELRAGGWRCHITKGLLFDGAGRRVVDELNDSVRSMGFGAVGGQPDIVIKFWHIDQPERTLFVLGDAKRNTRGKGEEYLRQSFGDVASYLVAYASALGLQSAPCRGALNPMVTLFCSQGVPSIAGCSGHESEQAERIRSAPRLPAIMALDLEHHFGLHKLQWRAPVLEAWFQRISDDACAALTGRTRERRRERAAARTSELSG